MTSKVGRPRPLADWQANEVAPLRKRGFRAKIVHYV